MTWDSSVVADGSVDIAHLRRPRWSASDEHGLRTAPLGEDPVEIVLPTGHALAKRSDISLGDLHAERILFDSAQFGL